MIDLIAICTMIFGYTNMNQFSNFRWTLGLIVSHRCKSDYLKDLFVQKTLESCVYDEFRLPRGL